MNRPPRHITRQPAPDILEHDEKDEEWATGRFKRIRPLPQGTPNAGALGEEGVDVDLLRRFGFED